MDAKSFNYKINDSNEIIRQILYANATFDIKDVINETSVKHLDNKNISSGTIITPSQMISGVFDYDKVKWSHQGFADLLLYVLYPNYRKATSVDEVTKVYGQNKDNVFIMTNEADVWVLIYDGINIYQYEQIVSYINNLIITEYIKNGNEFMIYTPVGNINKIEDINSVLKNLRKYIIDRPIPEQYPIAEIASASCNNEQEILNEIDKYMNKYYKGR